MLAVDRESVDHLTPGYFLTGKPLTAIPDQEHRVKPVKAMADVSTGYTAFLEKVEFIQVASPKTKPAER